MEKPTPDIGAVLEEILRDDLNIDLAPVTPDSRLIDDVGLDSVAFAVGIVAIEDKLGVAMSEKELLSCETVRDLETAIQAEISVAK
ncbi:acyl carrier protein [Candidatus Mycobacterium methanotrophicum]|uniref:Acyl carrier protein n=1 Tax=Candidatus Mycobacterium methanotrophicum TaxID=2943498 RepID=A0ABY4QFT8_9MYCO|nr:acyl carrier protein [Candidatus Mycobacterium methanotrophicum]UQX09852.1 acyl carrier protein [Candidatus Mycobacterium methanotrophicum]